MSLRSLRKKAGLSLPQAAVSIGVYPSTLMRWEKGETSAPVDKVPAIQRAYNLTDAEVLSLLKKEPA